jgi:outer membrane protein with beta-barrel domain
MKHFTKLLFALLFLPFFSLAQSNYKAGYVVTVKGDTVHGFIDIQGWDSNPRAISFKTDADDRDHKSFTVSNIRFFSVPGVATYQKFTCSISLDETSITHLASYRDTSYKVDSVFLKVLQKGKNVALYEYTDGVKTRFYIGEAADYVPTELVYRIYDDTGNAAHKEGNTVVENTFLKQLFALANKYNVLTDKLTNTLQTSNYIAPDLLVIVSKINDISKSEFSKKYSGNSKTRLYVGAGISITNTTSTQSSGYTAGGGGPSTSYLPAVAFGANIAPNPDGRIAFRLELGLSEASFNSVYKLQVSPYVSVKTSYNQTNIDFTPQIVYKVYNSENFKFFLDVGFAVEYNTYSNAGFVSQDPNVSVAYISATNSFYFDSFDVTAMFKAGVQINKRWEIFADYFTSEPTSKAGYYSFSRTVEQAGIVYMLGK